MPKQIADAKAVKFSGYIISNDGETIVFEVTQEDGNVGHIAVSWLHLSMVVQLIERAAEKASEIRRTIGKSDHLDVTAQVVSGFQVTKFPDHNLKVLSLLSPTGLRWEFAIPTDTLDQRKRPLHLAIAEELVLDETEIRQRPN